jgi:MerR family transcriptional regulator, redox-sensitive transcriptional activator SoxR
MSNLTIGEVAAKAHIRPSAIRYYESIGVLPDPRRVNGQRRYSPDVLTQLAVIHMAQEAGFTISEIETLLHGFEPGTAASERWRTLAERKIGEIDALIARAEHMRRVLDQSLRCDCLTLDECTVTGWAAD